MENILTAHEVTKTFPGVTALDKVNFECVKGEVHALVGENGAGKSTFMRILAGGYSPDEGELIFKDKPITTFTPQNAQRLGIGIIYQELSLLPFLSVAENIFLGREPRGHFGLVDDPKMERQAKQILKQLDERIDPRSMVYSLSPAQRQLVEVGKALSFNPDLLIMDEPSSSLAAHELHQLFSVINSLKSQGVTIIYISHRLEEIFEIADRVTILKDGKKVDTYPVKDIDREKIIRLMVGREIEIKPPAIPTKTGEVVLEIHDLCRSKELYNINLTLHKGEILGVAGLMGAGRTELARAIFGVDPPNSGKILLNHHPIRITTPLKAIHQGIALVPEDRKADGLVLIHTLKENIALPSLEARQRFGFIDGKRESQEVKKSIDELSIHAASIDQQIAYLSGGNQQKAVLAKWLNCGPDVIICDEPTRGIDVGAKAEIYNLLRSLALAGKSILMISSELTEILQLSNRIIVLSSGRVAGELAASDATEEKILELAYRNVDLQATQTPKSTSSLQSDPFHTIKNAFSKTAIQIRGIDWSNATVYALLAIIIIVGLFGSKIFFTIPNLTNLLRQAFIPFSLAIGQTLVILSGGIDLSMGSIVTVTNVLAAGLMAGQNGRVLPVALFCLSIGILFGAVNAFSVIKLHVPPIIATLGTMTIGEGAALLYTRVPIGYIPRMLSYFANGNLGRVPFSAFVLVIVLVLAFVLLYKVPFGRHLYAVGGDEETSRLSGIAINRTRILAYLISGLLAAATGLYLVSRMGSGDPSVGGNLAMDAITAVLLGGTILGGGRGGLAGTTAGVLVLVVLSNVFNQMGIGSWYQEIAEGLIIIITVLIYPQSTKRV